MSNFDNEYAKELRDKVPKAVEIRRQLDRALLAGEDPAAAYAEALSALPRKK
jgi:hypothetical protein